MSLPFIPGDRRTPLHGKGSFGTYALLIEGAARAVQLMPYPSCVVPGTDRVTGQRVASRTRLAEGT